MCLCDRDSEVCWGDKSSKKWNWHLAFQLSLSKYLPEVLTGRNCLNLDTICCKFTNIVLFWCGLEMLVAWAQQPLPPTTEVCFTNPLILCVSWRIGNSGKVQFSDPQQLLKVVSNEKKIYMDQNELHSFCKPCTRMFIHNCSDQAGNALYSVFFADKASDFYNKKSKTSVIWINLNSEDLSLN